MHPSDLFKNKDVSRLELLKIHNKTENDINEDVNIIKKWLEKQPHLPETMPDTHIIRFLFLNKCSIEKTKKKIDMYYTIRSLIPDFYTNANPKLPHMQKCWDTYQICLHPKLVEGINRVVILKLLQPNTAGSVMPEIIIQGFNIAEVRFQEEYAYKDIVIFDLENFTIGDIASLTPTVLKKTVTVYGKVFSFPLKAAYLINAPPYITTILTILKTLLKPKIFERIHVSGGSEILEDIFAVDDLPEDYGGEGPSLQELTNVLRHKFDEYQTRFDQIDELRVDENLRPEPLVDDDMLGFYGNFRKLNVD